MTFLRAADGGLVNSSMIERIDRNPEDFTLYATLSGGKVVTLKGGEEDIELQLSPIVPATPDFTLLSYCDFEYGEPVVRRTPITAWQVIGNLALPIAPDDGGSSCIRLGVLTPDGQVIDHEEGTYENEAEWRKAIAKQVKGRKLADRV